MKGVAVCVLVLLAGVVALCGAAEKKKFDSYPDPTDVARAVQRELREYKVEKAKADAYRKQQDAVGRLEVARFKSLGPAAGGGATGGAHGATGAGATGAGASGPVAARLPKVPKAQVNFQLTLTGSIPTTKGDSDLRKALVLVISEAAGVAPTAVSATVQHREEPAKPQLRRRRLLQAATAGEPKEIIVSVCTVAVNATVPEADTKAFAGIRDAVQDGTMAQMLKKLGFAGMKVTGLTGGPDNEAVAIPSPASCGHTTCSNCASTP